LTKRILSVKSTFREYGVIAALIIVSVSGYLLFSQNKEDILAYSLDVLGTKLVALIDDDSAKMRVSVAFDRFQQQVMNQEVSSEQVELIAANVLNLSHSGARLSPEEAELVLTMKPESFASSLPAPSSSPLPPTARSMPDSPEPVVVNYPANLTRLGENLEAMFQFSSTVEGQNNTATRFIRFESDDQGIHVIVDPELEKEFRSGTFWPATDKLDKKKMVRWKKELEKDIEKRSEWFESEAMKLANLEHTEGQNLERSARIKLLTQLRHLQSMGISANADSVSLSLEIANIVSSVQAEIESVIVSSRAISVVRSDSLGSRRQ
jgi:hypothetical protein